ncbi:hypothetical protein AAHC03_013716 [Spirometra sp. Aus1]
MDFDDDFPAREDEEVAIPRASLNKFIKDILPEARLTNETRELILSCCHRFIHHLSTMANIACTQANKKTINTEHILNGLDAMGLSSYKAEARAANEGAKVELKDRRMLSASYKFKQHDSEQLEQLREEQQKIFEQARATFLEEQMDKSDLLAAAASTVASLTKYSTAEGSDMPTQDAAQSQGLHAEVPTAPASALLLGITALSEEDNYD